MIKIISCFWNASEYIEKCVNSIVKQSFKDFKVFMIDDVSSDDTKNKLLNATSGDERFNLIFNTEKKGKLRNMDELIMNEELFDDEDIIIELDGDDWFFNEKVLEKINNEYETNKKLWLTNGSFIYSDNRFGFSSKVNPNTIRKDVFTFSHLRTWKCHLWRNIDEDSFMDEEGNYFMSAPDVAYSLPLVELAGEKHYKFIPDILYVYNAESPYNEHKPNSSSGGLTSQINNANYIRNKKQYKPILKR